MSTAKVVAEHTEEARLDNALDHAEAVMGAAGVVAVLVGRGYGEEGLFDGWGDAMDRIARLAHEGHDRFAPRHCDREVCREIERLRAGGV